MINKKSIALLLTACLLVQLTACGSEQKVSEGGEVTESVSETGAENKTETEVESEDESKAGDQSETEAESETETNAEPEAQPETKPETEEPEKPAIVDKTWVYYVDTDWIDPEKPMVALSFDDGPVSATGENSTATRIQNALADNGMHATFFYWGNTWNSLTQKEIERAYELGFELGNHTKTHADLAKLLDKEKIAAEVEYIDNKLAEIAQGQEHFLVRPPYLSVNQSVKDAVIAPLVTCGIDSLDWTGVSAQEIIDKVVAAAENGNLDGQIVLMHETYISTAEAVEYLVPYLKEQGYQVVSVSELYCVRGKTMSGGKVYTKCD